MKPEEKTNEDNSEIGGMGAAEEMLRCTNKESERRGTKR